MPKFGEPIYNPPPDKGLFIRQFEAGGWHLCITQADEYNRYQGAIVSYFWDISE